jgi:predicted MPP superfamily phosphohydrolase
MWLFVKILAAAAIYGTAIEPRIVMREDHVAPIPQLPAAWEGKQVAVFADLQIGMWWANTDAVKKVVAKTVELNPAFVLIAGDFVYKAEDEVDPLMQEVLALLQPLIDARIPTYAVLGNHDYELMNEGSRKETQVARRVRFALDSAGIHMMDNRSVAVWAPGADSATSAPLYIVGVGDKWALNDSATATLAKLPPSAPRIVFMHDPDSYAHIAADQAPIAIAAHTHGMQLGIPWVSDWLWRTRFSDEGSGVAGWVTHYGQPGNRLYINRGIGFSILPGRINAFPELTVLTLTRAADATAFERR